MIDRLNHRMFALCCSVSMLMTTAGLAQDNPAPVATAPAATTQPEVAPDRPAAGEARRAGAVLSNGKLTLNFKDTSIDVVLDELSAVAGYVIVKEVKTEGRVTLVSRQPLSGDDAIVLLNTVLRNAGYAAIAQGRILKIVSRDKAKRLNIPVRSGSDPTKIEPTDELITQVIPLRFADATQLKSDLAPLMNPEADFTANASSNALVITDTAANVRRVVQIVAALDTSLADASEVKVFQLQFANATNAARLINEVFGTQSSASRNASNQQQQIPFFFRRFMGDGAGGGAGGPGAGGPGGGAGGAAGNSSAQSGRRGATVSASSDERTNTIVVTGPGDTLRVVERVVKEIDSNPAAEESVMIYNLKNAQAVNLESVLNNLFGSSTTNRTSTNTSRTNTNNNRSTVGNNSRAFGGGAGNSSSTGNRGAFGSSGAASGGAMGNSRTTGTASPFGSAPNLSGNAQRAATDLSGEVSIIADADTNSLLVRTAPKNFERVKQVISELDRPVAQVLIKVLIAEVTHSDNVDLGIEFSAMNLRPNGLGTKGGTDFGLKSATGGMKVQVLEANFETTIRALQTLGKVDVLSRPYILASDNQLASITVGQEVPFITSSRITDNGQTINTVEYGDVGILLDVIPHINPEGLVILDVAPEISALTTTNVPISETVNAPVFSKRSAQSRVGVRNGQTVVIGGLMEDRRNQTIDQVPLLGDIPLLGELFKRRRKDVSKTELLIFLTPQVAPKPDLLKEMSEDELRGTKLTPNAVKPGAFQEHMEGMKRGATPTTQPTSEPAPTVVQP